MLALTLVVIALAGAAIGSFAGVVSVRGWRASMGGRSHCDACGRTLAAWELVPLLSYPALRGRCRTCGARIGWAPWMWEIGGALAATVAGGVALWMLAGRT